MFCWVLITTIGISGIILFNIPLLLVFAALLVSNFSTRVRVRGLAILLSVLFIPLVLNSAHHRMAAWDKKIQEEGVSALTTFDAAAIYLGNFWMAVGGFCIGAPEASVETLLLAVPNKHRLREINWTFF